MSDIPPPQNRVEVLTYVDQHYDGNPVVRAPACGYSIGNNEIWPGDILARDYEVALVVDVTDGEAICWLVDQDRYMVYEPLHIDRDIDSADGDQTLYHYRQQGMPPHQPGGDQQ